MDSKIISRFWKKVDKNGPVPSHVQHLGPCWRWTGKLRKPQFGGYGVFVTSQRREVRAHRFSWQLHNVSEPGQRLVCHGCDNPACVNPTHLFLGTQLDNVRDAISKRRNSPPPVRTGEANNRAKLTADVVLAVRRAYAAGETQQAIGDRFGMRQTEVSNIVLCKIWKHLPGAAPQKREANRAATTGANNHNAKMTPERVREMRQQYQDGSSKADLARNFGVNPTTVQSIVNRLTWRHVG